MLTADVSSINQSIKLVVIRLNITTIVILFSGCMQQQKARTSHITIWCNCAARCWWWLPTIHSQNQFFKIACL